MRPIETWHLQLKRVSKDIYIVCDTRKLQHFIFWIFHTRCLPLSLFLLYLIQGSRGTEQTSTRSAVRIQSPLILPLYLLLKVPKETPKTLKTASHIRSRIQVFFFSLSRSVIRPRITIVYYSRGSTSDGRNPWALEQSVEIVVQPAKKSAPPSNRSLIIPLGWTLSIQVAAT